jgi:hypothetical protein
VREVLRRLGAARWAAVGPQPSSHWLGCLWGVTARVSGRQGVDGEGLSCTVQLLSTGKLFVFAPRNLVFISMARAYGKPASAQPS